MYIDDICSICPSCAFFAGNVCAAYQCELKELIGTWCNFFEDYKDDKNDEDDCNFRAVKGEMQEDIASVRGFSYNTLDILKHPSSFLQFLDVTYEDMHKFISIMQGKMR